MIKNSNTNTTTTTTISTINNYIINHDYKNIYY